MNNQEKKLSPSIYKKAAAVVAISIFFVLLVLLVGSTFKVLLFVLTGILFAAFFRGIASWISKVTKLSMKWSLTISVLLTLLVVVVFNLILAPTVQRQVQEIAQKLPSSLENARNYLNNYWWGQQLLEQVPKNPQKFLSQHAGWAQKSFGLLSSTFGVLADIYIILIIGIFLMVNPAPYVNGLVSLVPSGKQGRAREIIRSVYTTLQRWLTGKLLSMLIVAVLTFIGLLILKVPLPLVLALIAGILAFIPNFGPIFSLIPAVLIGFLQSPATALYVVILYIIVQAIESNFITPFIQREMVALPLAMVIIAQVVLGVLVGGLGLILATPIVAVAVVLIRMIYIEDILGQKVVGSDTNS